MKFRGGICSSLAVGWDDAIMVGYGGSATKLCCGGVGYPWDIV